MRDIMKIITALVVSLALSGCMSYSSTVGGTTCSFSGYGIIGGAIASSNYNECIAQAKEKEKEKERSEQSKGSRAN
jgi:hypothetical protein